MYLWIKASTKYVVFEKVTRYCLKDCFTSEVNQLYIATTPKMVKNNMKFIAEVIVKSFFFKHLQLRASCPPK